MSKKRHAAKAAADRGADDPERDLLVRSYAVTHPADLHLRERVFDRYNQLTYAARGVMDVTTDAGTWVVPPHRAVWIPAGVRHAVRMSGAVALRTLYFKRGVGRGRTPRACQAVNVTPLLRELVLQATRIGLLHRTDAREARLAQVILDQLETLATVPLQLPWPHDQRARAAAQRLLENTEPESLTNAARRVGASKRTLERLFLAETSMTLGRWRQRARLIHALRLLARGGDVTTVALEVGYNSPSAFIVAFRNQLGTTPARYFATPPA